MSRSWQLGMHTSSACLDEAAKPVCCNCSATSAARATWAILGKGHLVQLTCMCSSSKAQSGTACVSPHPCHHSAASAPQARLYGLR